MNDSFRQRMQQIADNQAASPKSPVISQEKYEAIRKHLLDRSQKVDPHFKHWVKKRQFQIVDIPDLGLQQILAVPNEQNRQVDAAVTTTFLRVVHARELYDIVNGIHAKHLKHSGYKKVLDYAQRHYFGITRGFIQEYCKHCPECQLKQSQTIRLPVQSNNRKNFLEMVQVDLIDMRHSPDREFNYIGHFMDHFSNFHVLFPLKEKHVEEVAIMLEERVLAYFGPPKIFHSSNGREFVNELIQAMLKRWGGDTMFVNGQTRNSQLQNLVEAKIAAMKQENNIYEEMGYPWASWLPRIMFSMNSARQEATKVAPYHIVFGRSIPTGIFPSVEENCIDKEDLEDTEVESVLPTSDYDQLPSISSEEIEIKPHNSSYLKTSDITWKTTSEIVNNDQFSEFKKLDSQPMKPNLISDDDIETQHKAVHKQDLDSTYNEIIRLPEFCKKRIKVEEFSVGDRVSVAVSKLDRSTNNISRIPCVVSEVYPGKGMKTYSLSTKYGILNTKFTGEDLQDYSDIVVTNDSEIISPREAAQKFYSENKFMKTHLNCEDDCKSEKCV